MYSYLPVLCGKRNAGEFKRKINKIKAAIVYVKKKSYLCGWGYISYLILDVVRIFNHVRYLKYNLINVATPVKL